MIWALSRPITTGLTDISEQSTSCWSHRSHPHRQSCVTVLDFLFCTSVTPHQVRWDLWLTLWPCQDGIIICKWTNLRPFRLFFKFIFQTQTLAFLFDYFVALSFFIKILFYEYANEILWYICLIFFLRAQKQNEKTSFSSRILSNSLYND